MCVYQGPARAGPRPVGRVGPQPMGRAGPLAAGLQLYFAGRAGCWPETYRPGPGPSWLANNNFDGPGLGLTFPRLGPARACNESHPCVNIMV